MGNGHADSGFDLLRSSSHQRTINSCGSNSAVNDMVDFILLERKDLRKAAADLVKADHRLQGFLAVNVSGNLRRRHDHRIEIVVAEFTRSMAWNLRIVAKNSAV